MCNCALHNVLFIVMLVTTRKEWLSRKAARKSPKCWAWHSMIQMTTRVCLLSTWLHSKWCINSRYNWTTMTLVSLPYTTQVASCSILVRHPDCVFFCSLGAVKLAKWSDDDEEEESILCIDTSDCETWKQTCLVDCGCSGSNDDATTSLTTATWLSSWQKW